MKYRTSQVILQITVVVVVVVTVNGLSCPPISSCNRTLCTQPLVCPGGKVKDVCGCCDECARQKHQACGGTMGLDGQCDKGLICVPLPNADEPRDVLHGGSGVCLESHSLGEKNLDKLCISVVCEESAKTINCPEDSVIVSADPDCCPSSGKVGDVGGGLMCKCDPRRCHPDRSPICDESRERKVLARGGTGIPGDCCPIYQCVSIETNCSLVDCSKVDLWCPDDSYPLPRTVQEGECCSKPGGCKCLPIPCKPAKCSPGQRLKVVKEGTGNPGSCCPQYHCIAEGEQTCVINGVEYLDGETWKADKCTFCTCKGNVTFCNAIECNTTSFPCGQMKVPPGECCAVCTGCISDGAPYANGDSWREGDCNLCTCINGRVECQAEFCALPCANPKKIPGQCCPHCDEPTVVTLPSSCPPLSNCTLLCANGLARDNMGCFTCHCQLDGCDLTCEHGYAVDDSNRSVCKCNCPPLVGCDKKCIHGFKSDSKGCPVCRCFSCRSLKCAQKCPYGHVRNARGCRTCKCMSGPEKDLQTTTEISHLPSHKLMQCHLKDGLREEDEMWHDGCRTCYCHGGREFCALINCPLPPCEHPVIVSGECCPRCIESAIVPKVVNTVVCPSTDGGYHLEGEMWKLDSCTPCVCHNGQMFCGSHDCSPAPCPNPIYLPGRCCPQCTDVKKSVSHANRSCSAEGGKVIYDDGALWWAGDCQSCKCSYGKIACFPIRCPKLNCDRPVLKKGQCCPFCVEMKRTSCLHDDILHDAGQMWMLNECTQCMCLNGQTMCKERVCNQRCNGTATKIPGQCCPICIREENQPGQTKLSTQAPPAPPNGSGVLVTTPRDINTTTTTSSCWTSMTFLIVIGFAVVLFGGLVILFTCCVWKWFKRGSWRKKKSFGEVPHVRLEQVNNTTDKLGEKLNGGANVDLNNKCVHLPVGMYDPNEKLLNNKPPADA